jgi:hypothetical protein
MLKLRREEDLKWKLLWPLLTKKSSNVFKKNIDLLKRRECVRRQKLQLSWLDFELSRRSARDSTERRKNAWSVSVFNMRKRKDLRGKSTRDRKRRKEHGKKNKPDSNTRRRCVKLK